MNRSLGPLAPGFVMPSGGLAEMFEVPLDQIGALTGDFTGVATLDSLAQPLSAVTDNTSGVIVVGGVGQTIVIPNASGAPRKCNEITPFSQAIPANHATSVRVDIIYGQALENPADPVPGYWVQQPGVTPAGGGPPTGGAFTPISQTSLRQDVQFGYLQGVPGAGAPTVPSGFVAMVQINVQTGGGVIQEANISVVLPTFPLSLLQGLQPLLPFVIVTGADPTGTNDSLPALQTAIALAVSAGIRRVLLPGGTFLFSDDLSYSGATYNNLIFQGAGSGITTLVLGTPTQNGFALTSITNFRIESLTILGCQTETPTAGSGIVAASCNELQYTDVVVLSCYTNMAFSSCQGFVWSRVRSQFSLGDGAHFTLCNGGVQGFRWDQCLFASNQFNGTTFVGTGSSPYAVDAIFTNTRWIDNNAVGGNASGLNLQQNITRVSAVGCEMGGVLAQQHNGVFLDDTNDFVTLANCPMYGNVGSAIALPVTAYGPNCNFTNCPPFMGFTGGPTTFAIPATNTPVPNQWGCRSFCTLNPNGASITAWSINGHVYRADAMPITDPLDFVFSAGAVHQWTYTGGSGPYLDVINDP